MTSVGRQIWRLDGSSKDVHLTYELPLGQEQMACGTCSVNDMKNTMNTFLTTFRNQCSFRQGLVPCFSLFNWHQQINTAAQDACLTLEVRILQVRCIQALQNSVSTVSSIDGQLDHSLRRLIRYNGNRLISQPSHLDRGVSRLHCCMISERVL